MDITDTLKLNGKRISYARYGEGPPLILLHGWTQTSAFWRPYVDSLSEEFELFVPDLPGHGKSGTLPEDFSIQATAQDVMSFIEALGLEHVHGMGLSFGAIILLEIAHTRPDLLESMILISAVYEYNGKENASPEFAWENLPDAFRQQLLEVHPGGEEQVTRLFDPDLDYQVHISESELGMIRIPALVVSGEHDQIAGSEAARGLHRNLPQSSLWIIQGKGHVPVDNSNLGEFIDRVREFYSSLPQ